MITNKEKVFISAVVYVHNSQDTILFFLKTLLNVLLDNFEKFEIICVDDSSTDSSVKRIKDFCNESNISSLSIVNMSFYQGIESAMNAGIDIAIGDFVFEFDNNIVDYDVQTIMEVYYKSQQGIDIVAASNSKKKFVSSMFYKIFNKSANSQYKIGPETFRILSRRAINRIHAMSKTIPYRKALYSSCGLKIDMVVYQALIIKNVQFNRLPIKTRQDMALNTLILFTDIGYKVSILMTFLMMLATFAGIIYTILVFILKQPVAGYTTIMLMLTSSFFGVFAILAIIIKYLSLIIDLVFKKQKYIIESIEKILN